MYTIRVLDLKTKTITEKTLYEYDFYEYKNKIKFSKNLRIISEMRVF